MSGTPKLRPNKAPPERIMVAVRDEGAPATGQGSLIDNTVKAERIVAGLIEAGVEAEAVTALRARELPVRVAYKWTVELLHKGERQPEELTPPAAAAPASPSAAPPAPPGDVAPGPPATAAWTATATSGAAGSSSTATARPTPPRLLNRAGRLLEDITPESPFQFRLDRVLWLGLWAASLLILAVSLLASLSRGSAREFVVGSPSSSEREVQSPGAALDSNSRPEAGGMVSEDTWVAACARNTPADCQCNDFPTQPEAQAFFEQHPPASGHDVDPDRDGAVCEWLPGWPPEPGG